MSDTHVFLIYTQPDCRWCDKAKALIHAHGFAFIAVDITTLGEAALVEWKARFGPNPTVPQVLLGATPIGGFEQLKAFFQTPQASEYLRDPVLPPIQLKRLDNRAKFPVRGSENAIGLDLFAVLPDFEERMMIVPNEARVIPTGWAMTPPPGHYLRVAPRSGLAVKHGIDVLAGVIDRDYTGEIKVVVTTHECATVEIRNGQAIAQIIAERASIIPVVEVAKLAVTKRGEAGFGSTG